METVSPLQLWDDGLFPLPVAHGTTTAPLTPCWQGSHHHAVVVTDITGHVPADAWAGLITWIMLHTHLV